MVGKSTTHRIMRLNASQTPATAVKIDQRGERSLICTCGRIETNGQRACGAANETILNRGHHFRFSCLRQSRLLRVAALLRERGSWFSTGVCCCVQETG